MPSDDFHRASEKGAALPAFGASRNGSGSLDITSDVFLKTLTLTDLVDSTLLVEKLGDARANEVFIRHDRLARDLLGRYEGREIDKSDGFLLLFDRPRDAVAWALAYHRELGRLSDEMGVEIRARVGIHVGEVYLHENTPEDVERGAKPMEIEGLAKPVAARLMSLAGGGQTLLTQAAFELVRRALEEAAADTLSWVDHGAYHFKGVKDPVEVFEVGQRGIAPFSAPRAAARARQIQRRLLPILAALVLLAIAAGSYFIRTIRPAARARPAVAVLGFKNLSGQAEGAWLSTALAELLSTELAAGGVLRLIPGESVARMKLELSLPEADSLSQDTLEKIRRNLGTDYVVLGSYLFLERQLAIQPVLQSTASGERIPIPRERGLETELLDLVTRAGMSMRGALGAGQLSAPEFEAVQATLSASPVAAQLYFEGLEKLRRYEAVAARDVLEDAVARDPGYALAHAALSRAQSALGYDEKAQASARQAFDLRRDLPRQDVLLIEGLYYKESHQLAKAIQAYQTLWRFFPDNVDYGLLLAHTQRAAGQVQDALATVRALRELPEPSSNDPRIDLVEAQAAFHVADYRGELTLAERAFEKGQEQGARTLMAEALFSKGRTLAYLGELEAAAAALRESQRLFTQVGDRVSAVRAMNAYAVQLWEQGSLSQAEEIYQQALEILRPTGNKNWLSTLLNNRATLILERGDLKTAKTMLEESLAIVLEIRDPLREAERLANLAWVALEQGDLAAAEDKVHEALAVAEAVGSRQKVGEISYLMGRVFFAAGRLDLARSRGEEALAVCENLGAKHCSAQALNLLGRLLLAQGELTAGLGRLERAEAIRLELGEKGNVAQTRLARAAVLLELGRPEEARVLASEAAADLARAERRDDEVIAATVSAQALLAQQRLAEASALVEQLAARAGESQNRRARLTFAITASRVTAASGEARAALRDLGEIHREALGLGLAGVALEALWARGQVELAAGDSAGARADFAALAEEARNRGFGLLARKAEAAIADL